jgi:hypothetical protein
MMQVINLTAYQSNVLLPVLLKAYLDLSNTYEQVVDTNEKGDKGEEIIKAFYAKKAVLDVIQQLKGEKNV